MWQQPAQQEQQTPQQVRLRTTACTVLRQSNARKVIPQRTSTTAPRPSRGYYYV
jgi:hypothetical protein